MPRSLVRTLFLPLSAAGLLLSGCGGSSTHVVESNRPLVAATSSSTGTGESITQSASASTAGGTPNGAGSGGTPILTRTASAPAYVHEEAPAGELGKAVAALQTQGYTPASTADYHPNQTLRVLIGIRTGSADGYDQRAFFFLGPRYLGTDSSTPSAAVHVLSQGDTEVTLGYPIYRPGNPLCCPAGGEAHVTFQLNNGALAPAQPIPPVSERH